ncbi:hypothetical protein SprV_0702318200 [Sparganum proliferum]
MARQPSSRCRCRRRPQPPLHHLRRRHRPSAASGDQRGPRPPAVSPGNHQAVQQLSSGKTPGSDAIPAEIYKHGCAQLMDHVTVLFQKMWCQGEVPQNFKDVIIVHPYKRKGNRQLCDNQRGISLMNIAGKIFARILLNRLNNHLEQGLLPGSQCDFRRHRGTTDMIFDARQLQRCQ